MLIGNWWDKDGEKYDEIAMLVENIKTRRKPQYERDKQFARMYIVSPLNI